MTNHLGFPYLKFLATLFAALALLLPLTGCSSIRNDPNSLHIKCSLPKVPVYAFAQAFIGDNAISNAKVLVLETGETFVTNQQGKLAFCALPYKPITLILAKKTTLPWQNFQTTQTASVLIPHQGLQNSSQQISLQVPRQITYHSLQKILSFQHTISPINNRCTVATTIAAFGKTLADDPQGEPNATLLLWQGKHLIKNPPVIYFDIIFNKTNPFKTNLRSTSADGGAIIYNLKPSTNYYYLSAAKTGKHFSRVAFLCRPNTFINLSPPYSPRVLKKYETITH